VLERSINEIVRRHEILRTTFAVRDGCRVQVVAPHLAVPLILDDLHVLPRSKKQAAAQTILQKELLHSFDPAKGPLIRARLLRMAKKEHLLFISMHRAICDRRSLGIFVEELTALYDAFAAGRLSSLPALSIQYADFADWQRGWRSRPEIVAQLAYWKDQLRDPLPLLKLAMRPKQKTDGFRTARRDIALTPALSSAVKRFAQREGFTLFMALAAALKALLQRCTGENDIRLATQVANRNRAGSEGLIGPLANMVILRTSLAGDPSAREVMRRVRATALAAFSNQDIPFAEVVATLERERGLKPPALAQVMMWLQNSTLRPPATGSAQGLALEEAIPGMLLPPVTMTTFDVILMLRESTQGLAGICVYKPHLFGVKTIDRLLRDFQQVLEHMVTQPEQRVSAIPLVIEWEK
jgi:hypothetical protein